MRAIAVMVALTGCATRTVVISPGMVSLAASDLREHGRARVYAMDGTETEIHADDSVEVAVRQEEHLQTQMKLTLGEMAAGCGPDAPKGSCVADRVVDHRLVVRHTVHIDSDLVAKGVGFVAIGALTGYCLAECQDEGSVGRAFGYVGAVVAGTALLFMLAVALGGRD